MSLSLLLRCGCFCVGHLVRLLLTAKKRRNKCQFLFIQTLKRATTPLKRTVPFLARNEPCRSQNEMYRAKNVQNNVCKICLKSVPYRVIIVQLPNTAY